MQSVKRSGGYQNKYMEEEIEQLKEEVKELKNSIKEWEEINKTKDDTINELKGALLEIQQITKYHV